MAPFILSLGASGCCGLPRPLLIAMAISSSYKNLNATGQFSLPRFGQGWKYRHLTYPPTHPWQNFLGFYHLGHEH